jgi:hypothetical protein
MRFTIGIATKQKLDGSYIVCAATWFAQKPPFKLTDADIDEMKEELLSLVFTEGKKEAVTINSAIARSIEQLFIKELIANPENGYPPIIIHAPPHARVISTKHKFTPARGCWLMNCAKNAIEEYYVTQLSKAGRYASARDIKAVRTLPKSPAARRSCSPGVHIQKHRVRPCAPASSGSRVKRGV